MNTILQQGAHDVTITHLTQWMVGCTYVDAVSHLFGLIVDPDDALLGDAQQARLQLVLALDLLLRESEHT